MNTAKLAVEWQKANGDYAKMAAALGDEIEEELVSKQDLREELKDLKLSLILWLGGINLAGVTVLGLALPSH
jgi:hypothetical protein